MKRFPWIATLSCILLIYWQVRSRSRSDALVFFAHDGAAQALTSYEGSLRLIVSDVRFGDDWAYTVAAATNEGEGMWDDVLQDDSMLWGGQRWRFGFQGGTLPEMGDARAAWLTVPHWFPATLLALPALRYLRWRMTDRRRARLGLCRTCGYDLRASTGVCPECGRAQDAAAEAV